MRLDQRNARFEKKVEDGAPNRAIETLVNDANRRKRQLKLLAATIAFDVILTFGFGYVTIKTHDIALQADTNRAALIRSCETANESRANNKKLWDYILNIPAQNPRTPEQQQNIEDFKLFVSKTFEARNCSAIL